MHLAKLEITNFRSISKLSLDLAQGASLLVGPNAVGKTTVLEAVRLAKAVLAPRTQNEARQVLTGLGVAVNASQQQMNYSAIAGDSKLPVEIKSTYRLTDREVEILPDCLVELAQQVVASQHGIDLNNGQLNLVQFFSSDVGRNAMSVAMAALQVHIAEFAKNRLCKLYLTIDPRFGFQGFDGASQALFTVFERRLPPSKSLFSYFPADRALAVGDAQIQLGVADSAQQLESHNAQPALKYQRLKNVIFSTLVAGEVAAAHQEETFAKIFDRLLKGRTLEQSKVNQFGQATIMIRDHFSDKSFDIDSMSSGEKGLILTFLLIARSLQEDGIILLDEPELHLNSAVCKDLLDFLLDEYLLKMNVQAIICTHSPEIMSSALRREDCAVYNLKRDVPVSLIRKSDHAEAAQALKALGTSEIEALLFDAVVFVEGPDDVELLEFAFRNFLSRLRFRELSGRGEVEKYIRLLVAADNDGKSETVSYFIFDRDGRDFPIQSTKNVRIKQWGRYCLENYLIEPEILYDTVRQDLRPKIWPSSLGEANEFFTSVAKRQLEGRIVEEVYASLGLQDVRLRGEDKKQPFAQSAQRLYSKLEKLNSQISPLDQAPWVSAFVEKCETKMAEEQDAWSSKWIERCSGKQFLQDIYVYAGMKADMSSFKRALLTAHKLKDSDSWKLLNVTLQDLTHKSHPS